MEINLTLDEGKLKNALSEAILAQLGEGTRDEVIKQAIAFLVTPKGNVGYGNYEPRSPLRIAFDNSVETLCRERVLEFCRASPEVSKVLNEELDKAAKVLLVSNSNVRERLQKVMGETLANIALRKDD